MKVLVIGGGPSGMMCAGIAAEHSHEVTLIEKNEKLGKKLYITGKGRCNVANLSSHDVFMSNVVRNPKFLISAINAFDANDAIAFYHKMGVPLKVERGGRVFPESDKSSDIIKAHISHLEKNNVNILLNTQVIGIITEENAVKGVRLSDNEILLADAVVLATGGMSYPATGSTGDGYCFAEKAGHSITELKPALVPILLKESHELEGLSLKNVNVKIVNKNNKILMSEFGEMIFTEDGVSGPVILTLSSRINRLVIDDLYLSIDLKPALSDEQLDNRLLRDFLDNMNKDFVNSLDSLLPKSLIPEIIYRSDIDPRLKVHQIDKVSRQKLVRVLKDFRFTIKQLARLELGIITSGGVNVREINPKTMESKLVKGLYIIGEVLDSDALTGGFNIQIALSTGYLAGMSIE